MREQKRQRAREIKRESKERETRTHTANACVANVKTSKALVIVAASASAALWCWFCFGPVWVCCLKLAWLDEGTHAHTHTHKGRPLRRWLTSWRSSKCSTWMEPGRRQGIAEMGVDTIKDRARGRTWSVSENQAMQVVTVNSGQTPLSAKVRQG